MTERGLLIVFSGPSGVGKDTVLQELFKTRSDLALSVSATTRPPRPGEVDGKDYFFLTREQFQEKIESGGMLEYAEYSGNCYGTPAEAVERQRAEGRHVILEIEVQGALQIKEKCPDAVMIFLMPPSFEILRERLAGRGTEPAEVIEKRLAAAELEISKAVEYDYVICNHSVPECCERLSAVITAAACSTRHTTVKKVGKNHA